MTERPVIECVCDTLCPIKPGMNTFRRESTKYVGLVPGTEVEVRHLNLAGEVLAIQYVTVTSVVFGTLVSLFQGNLWLDNHGYKMAGSGWSTGSVYNIAAKFSEVYDAEIDLNTPFVAIYF